MAERALGRSGAIIAAPPWLEWGRARAEVKLTAGESFDNQHDARAGGTAQSWRLRRIDADFYAKQSAATFKRSAPSAVGEESEVADAHQAFGQNVKQESAQELMGGNGHDLLLAAMGIVPPEEGDAIVLEGHETMVGDGHAVCIAGQVVEDVFSASEGGLA